MNRRHTAVLLDLPASRLGLFSSVVAGAFARAVAAYREWRLMRRSRAELARLDDYQLRDIGLSRSQALFESGKSFFCDAGPCPR
jgi:uncharacterized protein YjiS (DUF1127 family)